MLTVHIKAFFGGTFGGIMQLVFWYIICFVDCQDVRQPAVQIRSIIISVSS